MKDSLLDWQREISAAAFADEQTTVATLVESVPQYRAVRGEVAQEAEKLVARLRKEGAGHGVEAFLAEYGLETEEGVAILCLAEALLRIPDEATADALIRDTFDGRKWETHLGNSESAFINASSWGLLLTGRVVDMTALEREKPAGRLKRLAARVTEPVVREVLKQAVKFVGTQFVMGTDMPDALNRARAAEKRGYRISYDILGEGARTKAQADHYFVAYKQAITTLGQAKSVAAPNLSIKLSALHPRYQLSQRERVMNELLPRVKELAVAAMVNGIRMSIDAEESTRLDIQLLLFRALLSDPQFAGYDGIGFVLQAYGKRAFRLVAWLAMLAEKTGHVIPVRLVKGAYWDSEIKAAQVGGLPGYPVFTRKAHTDLSYLACAEAMLSRADVFFPQFATHNAHTLAALRAMIAQAGLGAAQYEFQRLHGMGERLYDQIIGEAPCRIYAPVGRHADLLAYLIRRLLENGANSSFVNQLMDPDVPVATLLADPLKRVEAEGGTAHPAIPLPDDLVPWGNSRGVDFGNLAMVEGLEKSLQLPQFSSLRAQAKQSHEIAASATPRRNDEIQRTVQSAHEAQAEWAARSIGERAVILRKAADLLELQRETLLELAVDEAGKTLPDAIAEIREAADFCRYYAWQAERTLVAESLPGPTGERNILTLHPRGVWVCISPWNFPLAIFTGQIVAPLVTGNAVIAKPAEQTPQMALAATALLYEAGVPRDVLQCLPGDGETLGAALVAHQEVDGVCFTGSLATAKAIHRALAAREGAIIPLIAETGGQNAMIVDSSALLEQACDDIVHSAFGSAGQRCSALRVLLVQEEIADALMALIRGAMAELSCGDPARLSTDIGPVIDGEAFTTLKAYLSALRAGGEAISHDRASDGIAASATPPRNDKLLIFPPIIIELDSLDQLQGEQFGPILHVVRFAADELPGLPARINALGYGLTFGMHSRIAEHRAMADQVQAGNRYINRGMTGAVVGTQPFGGEGLSGTGPKAGGPHYLSRFCTERVTTINTAAMGGNLDLLKK